MLRGYLLTNAITNSLSQCFTINFNTNDVTV
jgi:hypothetical protein